MKKNDPAFDSALDKATVFLMDEFLRWNEIQGELKAKGYESNHCSDEEIAHERNIFKVIAERFILEDVDYRRWQWFETPWAGTDGNTGGEAYIVDFLMEQSGEVGWGILAFYVTRNKHYWHAAPLAEISSNEGLGLYQTNSIQQAIDSIERLCVLEQLDKKCTA